MFHGRTLEVRAVGVGGGRPKTNRRVKDKTVIEKRRRS